MANLDTNFIKEIMTTVNYMLNSKGYEATGIEKTPAFIKIYINDKEQNNGNNKSM